MVDLDYFKAANDTFGHLAGDALLKEVAERLTDLARNGDIVARIGGDEFVIVQVGIHHEEDDGFPGGPRSAITRSRFEDCMRCSSMNTPNREVGGRTVERPNSAGA
ncbi:GGDEF domain-containing protein [Bradyrhizobium sp. AZCC 2230]|uniref:GGDEF domain-containing protein n=1 Tax=Bradyrhizobium sp. AZCC 2230 TaxID=3117021 RepID=UPI003FA5D898